MKFHKITTSKIYNCWDEMRRSEINNLIKEFDEKTKRIFCIQFTIKCIERCLHKFTQVYPDDNRPLLALEAIKIHLKNPDKIIAREIIINVRMATSDAYREAKNT